ncbi:MAG: response regulator [Treponema sp.]|jgi:putative two-component system response regulator|nr:response regulator [Treponema sp.]
MDDTRKKIVVVDDAVANLTVCRRVLGYRYDVFVLRSGVKLFHFLEKITPDVILLDIDMPVMNGYEVLRCLRAGEAAREIPVIFFSANRGPGYEAEGLSLGAADYIVKPCSPQLLLKRVETQILLESRRKTILKYEEKFRQTEKEGSKTLEELQKNILKTVLELVDRRDEVTGGHTERTRCYVQLLFEVLVKNNVYQNIVQSWKKELLLQSAILYDLGKVSINDQILLKPGKLTDNEYAEMQKHTLLGIKILENIEAESRGSDAETCFLDYAKAFVSSHHEHWDGTGYPHGIKGYNIPLEGRIMAIADVYAALVTPRSYKQAYTHEEARRIILQGKGTQFDPTLVDVFLSVSDQFRMVDPSKKPEPAPR